MPTRTQGRTQSPYLTPVPTDRFFPQRLQSMTLPFRTSPTIKHTRFFSHSKRRTPKPLSTQTITPADSEEEFSPPFQDISNTRPATNLPQSNWGWGGELNDQLDNIMNTDSQERQYTPHHLDSDIMMLSPKASPCTLAPGQSSSSKLGVPEIVSGGRIPTPIYGHFRQSIDTPMDDLPSLMEQPSSFDMEYEKNMRARRLPTPISEDEAMDAFDSHTRVPQELPYVPLRQPSRFAPPLAYQSPTRGKPMFSMGFRADCEMCRNRVPGHYNHIFRP